MTEATVADATELTHWMAMKGQSWGKGDTKVEAKKQLRQMTGARGVISYYRIPKDYYIDEMGGGHGSAVCVHVSGPDLRG